MRRKLPANYAGNAFDFSEEAPAPSTPGEGRVHFQEGGAEHPAQELPAREPSAHETPAAQATHSTALGHSGAAKKKFPFLPADLLSRFRLKELMNWDIILLAAAVLLLCSDGDEDDLGLLLVMLLLLR